MPSVAQVIRRRRNRKVRRKGRGRRSALWLFLLVCLPSILALTPVLAGLGLSLWLYGRAASALPAAEDRFKSDAAAGVTQFYDRHGRRVIHSVVDPLGEKRRWLKLGDMPPGFIDATLLASERKLPDEGASFDPLLTLLQLWRYILDLPIEADGSIAGELARETILPRAQASGLDRDLLEIVLSAESKRTMSAEELLEWRINSQNFGHDAYGIEAAAQVYLGKSAESLTLLEAAVLAAVGAEPSVNPFSSPARAREGGADLLFKMLESGKIDEAAFDEAASQELVLRESAVRAGAFARAFIQHARAQAEYILNWLGLDATRLIANGDLKIKTALDLDLQLQSECLLRAHLRQLRGESAALSALDSSDCAAARSLSVASREFIAAPDRGALTLIDANSGQILSMVGAATAPAHQAGILLQPFVYMDAFLRREYTPASMVYDIPQTYPSPSAGLIYAAANADGRHRGPMNLRDAMAAGLLPPTAQVANANGIASAIELARALGFSSLEAGRYHLDALERGAEVSVLESAYAFSALASLGQLRGLPAPGLRGHEPVAILRIEDGAGNLLWSLEQMDRDSKETAIIEPSLAYLVNHVLADADARQRALGGPDPELQLSGQAAVIDGLSADSRDNWTVGYTPDLVLALHMDREDAGALSFHPYERAGTAPVWRSLMEYALDHLAAPAGEWRAPPDVEEFLVCEISGLLPPTTDHCPTRREIVPAGTRLRRDDFWKTVEINRSTGHLSTVNTPAHLREGASYFLPPEEILDWWQENGKPLPPSSYSSDVSDSSAKPVQIISPAEYAYLGARVAVRGRINRPGAETWRLEYGADVNPERWIAIGEWRADADGGDVAREWETALFSGIFSLRLTVTFENGDRESDSKLLTFDNTPPAVKLSTADGGDRYALGQAIAFAADVSDNLGIDRVEFYRGDELLGVDRNWPYGLEYRLESVGETVFRAAAFDQVGHRALSTLTISLAAEGTG